jgi:hypothetical protein
VPADLAATLSPEERDFVMETQEWFEQFTARKVEEGVQKAKESWQLETMARLCRKRLGRPLTEIENAALAERIDRLGEERVEEVILSSSPDALGIWLTDPNAK